MGYRINVTPVTPPGVQPSGVLGSFVGAAGRGELEGFRAPLIMPPNVVTVVILTSSLPIGYVGVPYSVTLSAQGGTLPYTWSEMGAIPNGLVFNSAAGTITGTPLAQASVPIQFTAQDLLSRNSQPVTLLLVIQAQIITPFTWATPGDGPWVL